MGCDPGSCELHTQTQTQTQTDRQTDRHTHTHLAIAPLPKDGEKLKALRPDSLAVSVDGGTGQLHLFRLDTNMRRQDESRVNGTLLSPAQIFPYCYMVNISHNADVIVLHFSFHNI